MTKTIASAIRVAKAQVTAAGMDADAVDFVFTTRMNWTRSQLILHGRDEITTAMQEQLEQDVTALSNGQPAQYITGRAPFWGRWFTVSPAVLIPQFDTELLIEWLLEDEVVGTVADIGTGSGAIGVTLKLERPDLGVTLVDISPDALAVATKNAHDLGADVTIRESDLLQNIGKVDVIVANLPYIDPDEKPVMDQSVIDFEPHLALFADEHGLALFRQLFAQLPDHLNPGGSVYLEFGYHQQPALAQMINDLLPQMTAEFRRDEGGNMRGVKITERSHTGCP